MKIVVKKNYEEASRYVADMFSDVIKNKPDATIGLATGSSPIGLYECLVDDYKNGLLDLSNVHTINLDEYKGLPRSHNQSFGYFMDEHLFSKVNIKEENIMLIKGDGNPSEEIKRYDAFLENNVVDIQVVGIGTNGHIGFNEPDSAFISGTHVTKLTEDTIKANSRFFEKESDVPTEAITMGIAGIAKSNKVVLIATGESKASAILRLLSDDKVDPMLPCSILKICRDATVVIDEALYNKTL